MVPMRLSNSGGLFNPRVLLCFIESYDMYCVCCNNIKDEDVIDNVKAEPTSDSHWVRPKIKKISLYA